MSEDPGGPGAETGSPPIDEYHRVLTVLSMALLASVVLLVGGAWVMVATGTFQPFLGLRGAARIGVALFLVLLLAAAHPLSRAVGTGRRPDSREEALAGVQTRVMVGMAIRDAVGAMAAVVILLAGDVLLGGTVGVLAVVGMIASIPRREELEEAVRRVPAGGSTRAR